ncbi:MAG TPA: serine/threonine protein kinase [Polyangiaceae bacterium]|nr:serine/threonine protein kinase [Polyangiaceae bacterium]
MIACPHCQAELPDDSAFCTSCGNRLQTQAGHGVPAPDDGTLAPGQIVDGKYRVVRVLGEGGMGIVYLAESIHTDVEVVIKAVRPEFAHRADIRQRTLDEGKALARIDHPNVVQLKAVVADDKQLLLIMQFIDGDDLEELILDHGRRGQPIPFPEVLRLFEMVLAGVGAAHDEGVIHRDLKPANILIRRKDGVAKVTDFGIAKPIEDAREGKSDTKGIIGSVHFMAPEQVKGQKDLDKRVDIYALGIMLFQMVTGRVPFDADNTYEVMKRQIEEPLPSVTPGRPDLPPALDGVLQRACAKDREHRFSSCEEFLQAVRSLRSETMVSGSPRALPGKTVPQAPAHDGYVTAPTLADPMQPMGAAQASHAPTVLAYGYGAAGPTQGTITGQPATYAPEESGGRSWIIAAVGAALVASVVTAVFLGGLLRDGETAAGDGGLASPTGTTTPTATSVPTATAEPEHPLVAYTGRWQSESGRQLEAVRVGDKLEFQVVDPQQFGTQGYRQGEARFVLHPVPDQQDTFAVEDHIRPVPPAGYSYDTANARTTCIAIWREAGGEALKAQGYGDRLDVDFAKIEPTPRNFVLSGRKVMSCKGLEGLPGTRIPSVLRKVD